MICSVTSEECGLRIEIFRAIFEVMSGQRDAASTGPKEEPAFLQPAEKGVPIHFQGACHPAVNNDSFRTGQLERHVEPFFFFCSLTCSGAL